jgi:hypothetical protein
VVPFLVAFVFCTLLPEKAEACDKKQKDLHLPGLWIFLGD